MRAIRASTTLYAINEEYILLLILIDLLPFNRKLQEDLTDEMVGLARQLKESSLMMNRSINNTEKVSTQYLFYTFENI